MNETPVLIACEDDILLGVISTSDSPESTGAVIVVAGGPQYRVGAHRQFVTLSRMLASNGISTIRFDHRGTGDSAGELRGFTDMNADIKAAIDTLIENNPQMERVILWGECESATAIAFYAHLDSRVSGVFMVNPWIRTEGGQAKTILKHYYRDRLFDKEFWIKLMGGKFSVIDSFKSFVQVLKAFKTKAPNKNDSTQDELTNLPLPKRLEANCARFAGKFFIITSGKDYIAQEFKDYISGSSEWGRMVNGDRMIVKELVDADHTFSRMEWREELFDETKNWVLGEICNDSK